MPPQQRVLRESETSPKSLDAPTRKSAYILPEDVVNLSSDRSLIPETPVNKKPSIPVTSVERKALQESFSVYA
jgi:hypothetical protein